MTDVEALGDDALNINSAPAHNAVDFPVRDPLSCSVADEAISPRGG
jgi:hypothetical protein